MSIEIDRARCARTKQCSYLHPELFNRDDDDYPLPRIEHPADAAEREALEEAIDLCPVEAISYSE